MLLASGRSLGLLLDKSTCGNCSVVASCWILWAYWRLL